MQWVTSAYFCLLFWFWDTPFPPWNCHITQLFNYLLGSKKKEEEHITHQVYACPQHTTASFPPRVGGNRRFLTLAPNLQTGPRWLLSWYQLRLHCSQISQWAMLLTPDSKWSLLSGHTFLIFCFLHAISCHPRLGIFSLSSGQLPVLRPPYAG